MDKISSKLFEKFEDKLISNLHFCTGGERCATTQSEANASASGCQKDSEDVSQTKISGTEETMRDYSDFRWECNERRRVASARESISSMSIQLFQLAEY